MILLLVVLLLGPFVFLGEHLVFQLVAILLHMANLLAVFALWVANLSIFVLLAATVHVPFPVAEFTERLVVFIVLAALPAVTRLVTLLAEMVVLNWPRHPY
jgi:hypothetical protein